MDELLKLFGAAPQNEEPQEQYQDPNSSLPGGGGVWEFESSDVDNIRRQNQASVYNVPPPKNEAGNYRNPPAYTEGSDEAYTVEQPDENQFSVPGGVPLSEIDIKESTVESYLSGMNLPFEKIDSGLWLLKYEGGAKDYEMFVELNTQDLRLVMPVLERVRDGCREKVWYHLLRLNYATDNISFGLNKRDEIFMVTQIPVRYISYDDFKRAFTYICTMMDEVYPELLFLAQKPSAVSSFLQPGE